MPPKQENKLNEPLSMQDQLQALIRLTTATNTRLDTLTTYMTTLVSLLTNQQVNQPLPLLVPRPLPPPPPQQQPRPPKKILPNIDGTNPLDLTGCSKQLTTLSTMRFDHNSHFQFFILPVNL